VDPRTLTNWLRKGKMAGWRSPGGRWHVDEDEVRRIMTPPKQGETP